MLDLFLQQSMNGFAQGMSYALIALGLTMVFGVLHIINFAHGEVYMLGALAAVLASTMLGAPYAVSVLLGVATGIVAAWLTALVGIGRVLERKDGTSTVLLTTFAISIIIYEGVLAIYGPTPLRIEGLPGRTEFGTTVVTNQRLFVVLAGFVVLVGIEFILRRTDVGRHIRALANSAFAAQVVGIDVARIRLVTFVGAGALAGLTGALMVPITLFSPVIGHSVIINAFVVVVVGGMGSASGAVVCGLALGLLEAYATIFMPQQFASALIYALLLVTLMARPNGLFGGRARA